MLSKTKNDDSFTLITGATSSLGRAVALSCAKRGNLLLHGRDVDALNRFATEISGAHEIKVWCRDLGELEGLNEAFLAMLNREDIRITKVVHAAGHLKILPFRSFKFQDTMNIFSVNVFSIIEILRGLACKPHRDHLKSVVMISAYYSKFGDKGNAVYSSSKGALNSLIKGLAVEFPQTRFNSIILGAVRTKMTEHLFNSDADSKRFERYILGTGKPDQVADAVDFLLKDTLWMTGQEIFLDGGASIA
jgi:NAD(P)-dependent dehydrogenase (short-subunit alcohol dehydrogenase family)